MINHSEEVEKDLREKIFSLNKELEKAIVQIEENRIIKESDNEEIIKLENENHRLR